MEAIALALINKIDLVGNFLLIVLVGLLCGCSWMHVIARREDREDRKVAFDVVAENTKVLNELRIVLATTGKVL